MAFTAKGAVVYGSSHTIALNCLKQDDAMS